MIDWSQVKVVIFDIDGTVYDQARLRRFMVVELSIYYIFRPWLVLQLLLLAKFRRRREAIADAELSNAHIRQYDDVIEGILKLVYKREDVVKVVNEWIIERPLKYIDRCCFAGIKEFIAALQSANIKVAYYSDYPVSEKLNALGIDGIASVANTEKTVGIFKPNTKGLHILLDRLSAHVEHCVLIGDRYERDGACAERVGMQYLLKHHEKSDLPFFKSYYDLLKSLNR